MQRIMLAAAVLVAGCWFPASAENEKRICWNEWGSPKFFQKWSSLTSRCLLGGADPNKSANSRKWYPPIFMASKYAKDVQVIHELVKAGADPVGREPDNGNTPLHLAATILGEQNIDIIKALLDYGADPNARDIYGSTPLLVAFSAKGKHEPPSEVVELLLKAGADPNLQNRAGASAMTRVSSRENRRLLVMAGAMYNPARKQRSGTLTGIMTGLAAGVAASDAGINNDDAASLGGAAGGLAARATRQGNNQPLGQLQTSGASRTTPVIGSEGACQIPGYPNDPGPNLSFTWCPAGVSLQLRASSLQVAVLQCEIATGLLNGEQVSERKTQIAQLCKRIDDAASSNTGPLCRCPQESR